MNGSKTTFEIDAGDPVPPGRFGANRSGRVALLERPARPPAAQSTNPLRRLASDLVGERRLGDSPPGALNFDLRRSLRMARDPLGVLMPLYREFGPVFSVRVLHSVEVFAIGPEANHFITVSGRDNFSWREGSMGELLPLLGDGLLTTDGEYHERARAILMPAFHSDRVTRAMGIVEAETRRALAELPSSGPHDVYSWARHLAIDIAMRALLGLDPHDRAVGEQAAHHFEDALHYYGADFHLRFLRGPGTPWKRTLNGKRGLDEIIFAEISRRRSHSGNGGGDILTMLLAAESAEGLRLSDREVRDQAITLLFAGHDTVTSTISFLLYELARNGQAAEAVLAETDDRGGVPAAGLTGELPALRACIDETLRLYPPAWVGPRRAISGFELAGVEVRAGASVNYCSLVSHRLPEVFEDPDAFMPERFSAINQARLPRGAYVPFGAGPRVCIGKRFAIAETEVIAATLLRHLRPRISKETRLRLRPMPTLSPEGGLPLRFEPRD